MIFHNRIEADVARTPSTPLRSYIVDFLYACEAGTTMKRPLSQYTIKCYGKTLRHLDDLMRNPSLAGFTEMAVTPVISAKRKTSVSSAALMARTAKSFASWLYRKRFTSDNRLTELGVPIFNGRRHAFTDKELLVIRDALTMLPNRTRKLHRALVLFAIGSGIRSNEMRTLMLKDVHIETPLEKSWAFIRWDVTKTQRERSVRIADEAAVAIHEYIAADRPEYDGPLFLSEEGKPYSYEGWRHMWGRLADTMENYGIMNFGAHRCRHEWATLGARAGMTQAELEQEGGWERGSSVPAGYIEGIPFEEIQKKPSPMTVFLRRVS